MLFGLWSFSVSVLYLFFCRFFQAVDWSKNLPPDCRERYWLASISTVKQVGIKNSLWACSPTLIFLHPLATLHLLPPPPSAPRYNDHRSYISLKLVVQTFRLTRCVCVCVCGGGGGVRGGEVFSAVAIFDWDQRKNGRDNNLQTLQPPKTAKILAGEDLSRR